MEQTIIPQKQSKTRQSNIELLRIVSMALIIAAHMSYWGGAFYHTEGMNKIFASLFICGGKLGVTLFVMIGSIFMAKKTVSFKGIFRIFLTMMLVHALCSIAMYFTGEQVSFKSIINPFHKAWFVYVYIWLMLVSPWLNKLSDIMDFRVHRNLCIVLTLICAVYPSIVFADSNNLFNQFVWFVYLYILVNFFLKYKLECLPKAVRKPIVRNQIKIYIFTAGAGYAFIAYMGMISDKFFPLRNSGSIIMLLVALCTFGLFYNKKMDHSSLVNWIAKGTFVAYLFHDDSYVRNFLWMKLIKCDQWYNSQMFFAYGILAIIGILLFGGIMTIFIDKVILFLLNKTFLNRIIVKLDKIIFIGV